MLHAAITKNQLDVAEVAEEYKYELKVLRT
jgi:hypothetical protein